MTLKYYVIAGHRCGDFFSHCSFYTETNMIVSKIMLQYLKQKQTQQAENRQKQTRL